MQMRARFHTLGSLSENIKQSFSRLAILTVGTINASLESTKKNRRREDAKDEMNK